MNNFDSIENLVYHVELDEDFNEYVGNVDAMLKQESNDQWHKVLDRGTMNDQTEVTLNVVFLNSEESN